MRRIQHISTREAEKLAEPDTATSAPPSAAEPAAARIWSVSSSLKRRNATRTCAFRGLPGGSRGRNGQYLCRCFFVQRGGRPASWYALHMLAAATNATDPAPFNQRNGFISFVQATRSL